MCILRRVLFVLLWKNKELFLNCCLLLRRSWQACFVCRTITLHVCSDFSISACVEGVLWCVALGWHRCITCIKSYCVCVRPLLSLSCVKGFFVFCFSFFLQGVLFSSLCLERNLPDMMHLWSEIFNKYGTLGFVCLCFCMCFGVLSLPPTIPFFLEIILHDFFLQLYLWTGPSIWI